MKRVIPAPFSRFSIRASSMVAMGSRLAEGSSRTRIFGAKETTDAKATFCFSPSESDKIGALSR